LEEQTVIIILHVPFVKMENLLPLYEFVCLPIHFNFSTNISIIPEVSQADLIAVSHTKAFQTLCLLTSPVANIWVQHFSVRVGRF
jgi:hypothetical protein